MKTITFYSYKGGVGRSLALSNIAKRLSQLNKKVCVIDFDLDAPGLRFKFFRDYSPAKPITRGIVDYIYNYSRKGILSNNILEYITILEPKNQHDSPISFISAGNIDDLEYWKKLSMINWYELFYAPNSSGIRFFLDLKAKIESEINPDYLLIDSRTGITDISGITLKIFADEVVVLAINNRENIFGSKKILRALLTEPSALKQKNINVTFVITRLPFGESTEDKEKEFDVIKKLEIEFKESLSQEKFEISVIHADGDVEEDEFYAKGSKTASSLGGRRNDSRITSDYLKLFDKVTNNELAESETYLNLKRADIALSQAKDEPDSTKKMRLLDYSIRLNSQNYQVYFERGRVYWTLGEYEKAKADFHKAIKLKPGDIISNFALGILNSREKKFDEAIMHFDYVIESIPDAAQHKAFALIALNRKLEAQEFLNDFLKRFPNTHTALNARADLNRRMGDFKQAIEDVTKAIELDPNEALYFATLAEIRANMNEIEGFYLSLTVALSKGLTVENMRSASDVYLMFAGEKKFNDLMAKYQIDVSSLFDNQ